MGADRERTGYVGERVVRLVPAILLTVLVIHFGFTLLYLTPPNPIKLRAMPVVDSYMSPLFEQSWKLFAPRLTSDTRRLLVSCRLDGGQADGQAQDAPWLDVTLPYQRLRERYRLTPAARLERVQMTPVYMLFGIDEPLIQMVLDKQDKASSAVDYIDRSKQKKHDFGKRLLGRIASAECDRAHGAGRTIAMRVRMLTLETPPFSRRHQPMDAARATYTEIGWLPYQAVAPL